MEIRLRIASLIVSAGLLVFILELVRRKRLKEKYSLLWLLMGISLMAMVLWPALADFLKNIFGILAAANMVLLASVVFIVLLCIHFSVRISSLSEQTRILAQELAMLKARDADDVSRRDGPEGKGSGRRPSA